MNSAIGAITDATDQGSFSQGFFTSLATTGIVNSISSPSGGATGEANANNGSGEEFDWQEVETDYEAKVFADSRMSPDEIRSGLSQVDKLLSMSEAPDVVNSMKLVVRDSSSALFMKIEALFWEEAVDLGIVTPFFGTRPLILRLWVLQPLMELED